MSDRATTMRERLAMALIQAPVDQKNQKAYWLGLADAVLQELKRPSPQMLQVAATFYGDRRGQARHWRKLL
jgi:hypothetical protein